MTRHAWTMPQYLASAAIGASSVHNLTVSALDYHVGTQRETKPKPGSDAAVQGSLFHLIVLQPELVATDCATWVTTHPDGKTRQRRGKAWDEFAAANAGKTIVTDKMMVNAERLAEGAMGNKRLQELLQDGGEAEVSHTWWRADCLACGWSMQTEHMRALPGLCPMCGAVTRSRQCKKRPDFETARAIIDLKLTRAQSPHAARREGYEYGWHIKSPWYKDGAKALGRDREFYFLLCQNVSPWDVALVPVTPDEMEAGRRDISQAMRTLGNGEDSGVWPGPLAPLEADGWERPHYAMQEIELEHDDD